MVALHSTAGRPCASSRRRAAPLSRHVTPRKMQRAPTLTQRKPQAKLDTQSWCFDKAAEAWSSADVPFGGGGE
jgi:hypothetical protein